MPRSATLLLALLLAVGCADRPEPPELDEPPPFEFRLGPGDKVAINVWGEQELNQEPRIGPDGVASFRLIGDVQLGGLTLDEARVELGKRFKGRGFKNPVVSLSLVEMRSHVLHVLGEVREPGTVSFVRGATVLAAIQAAGGHRPATAELTEVRLLRHRTSDPQAYWIDVEEILTGERRDVWLIPGDTIYVPHRTVTGWSRWWNQAMPWGDVIEEKR